MMEQTMSGNTNNFDASSIDPNNPYEGLPPGMIYHRFTYTTGNWYTLPKELPGYLE